MTFERCVELLKIEKQCVESANTCNRNCAECPLVQDDKELIEMYEMAISVMTRVMVNASKVYDENAIGVETSRTAIWFHDKGETKNE